MHNFNICLVMVLLVGCGTVPATDVDAGAVPDASTVDVMEVQDAGTDAAADADAGTGSDASPDAGSPDAAVDGGTAPVPDAGTDAPPSDSGTPDAGVDAGTEGPGVPVALGVSGDGSCLLTDDNEMWCWGYGNVAPIYVADAVALNGTCAIALDGHAFCWGESGVTDYAGTDVAVLGVQAYASRPAGEVRGLGLGTITPWVPTTAVSEMSAQFCATDINGGLTCWDLVDTDPRPIVTTLGFGNFWDVVPSAATYDVTDAARRGAFGTNDIIVCHTWTGTMPGAGSPRAGPGIECLHSRGTATPATFADATEVEIAGGRACALVPVDGDRGDHPAGVYCTADRPATFGSTGHWPLNPLPAGDAFLNPYTNIVGTGLAVGTNHACIMQGSSIMCWGDNRRGQLGDGTVSSSRAPQSIVW